MKKFSLKKKSNLVLEDPTLQTNKSKQSSHQLESENLTTNEKLSLHSVQRHLSILRLEEYLLIITLITTAVLGRVLLQPLPSIEPITFIALLAGSLFGIRKGMFVGASSWYLSNFFMFGGQGPWTLVHIGSGIVAGALGGLMLKRPTAEKTMNKSPLFFGPREITKISPVIKSIIAITLSTIIFELAINTMSGILFYGLITSFITAIPFAITHIISNAIFSTAIPRSRTIILKKGKLDEIAMCQNFITKLKQKRVATNEL